MGRLKRVFWTLVIFYFIFIPGVCFGDDTSLFSATVEPDALILLDLSGSMNNNPADQSCFTSGCSKLAIAQSAIFALLDADSSGTINSNDETTLQIRIGYMRFYNCQTASSDNGTYNGTGCVSLRNAFPAQDAPFISPSRYIDIWNNVNGESASGGTPLAGALSDALLYLNASKAGDAGSACRQKFVILITDGNDTFSCNGNGAEVESDDYKRRKATVQAAQALYNAGYMVFVIGFGSSMPAYQLNTLNWTAYYGGTNNLSSSQSGSTSAITISQSMNACAADTSNDPGNATLSGYAFVATNAASLSSALKRTFTYIGNSRLSFATTSIKADRTTAENFLYASSFQPNSNDSLWPGHLVKYNLNSDGTLGSAVWDAGSLLASTNPSTRNILTYVPYYSGMGSFSNLPGPQYPYLGVTTASAATPIVGYIEGLASYNPENWLLGDIFHSNPIAIGSPSPYFIDIRDVNNAFAQFRTNNQRTSALGNLLVVAGANDGQLHAFAAGVGNEQWSFIPPNILPKLRFIAHSTLPTKFTHQYLVDGPVMVADVWLGTGDGTSKSATDWHTLLVFAERKGVRDKTSSATPPANPWNSYQSCAGTSNATYTSQYPYYCGSYAWSSSPYCDTNYNNTYTSTYQYYCGYYALDVTNTSATTPTLMWRLNPNSTQAPYLGEPWSKMAIGKVIINGSEKWVGFIGAGYPTGIGSAGMGFFVVDLTNGNILWSYTNANNSSMTYGLPASPAIVDTDNDGFIDTAYVGDLGGNMWRFTFCSNTQGSSCGTGQWSGGLLFQASSGRPIYTAPAVASDSSSLWVFWGTGDKENPTSTTGPDSFFAVKDNDRITTYSIGNLQNISAQGTTYNGTSSGWYLTFAGTGEKMVTDLTVFGGIVAFTTYIPSTSGSNPCLQVGTAQLYAIAMTNLAIGGITYAPGAGVLSTPSSSSSTAGGARSVSLGAGMAETPIVSQNPVPGTATDMYLTLSGGGGTNTNIITTAQLGSSPLNQRLTQTSPSTQILHWRDGRIQ